MDWYIDTMNQVFLVAENLINDNEVDGFIHLLAESKSALLFFFSEMLIAFRLVFIYGRCRW